MAIRNVELMHECSPEHLRTGTAKTKYDKEKEEEGQKKRVSLRKENTKKSPDGLTVTKAYRSPRVANHNLTYKLINHTSCGVGDY